MRAADFEHRIEHGLQIERRATDDLEHVGSGGLLLQRFAQLVEQPRVLDGDDGLGGEVLDQLDLLVGEGTDLLTIDENAPISSLSLSIGTTRRVRAPAVFSDGDVTRTSEILLIRQNVCDVDYLPRRRRRRARPRCRVRMDYWIARPQFGICGGALCSATARYASPSRKEHVPNLASQIRAAFSSMALNTGSSSPGEL